MHEVSMISLMRLIKSSVKQAVEQSDSSATECWVRSVKG